MSATPTPSGAPARSDRSTTPRRSGLPWAVLTGSGCLWVAFLVLAPGWRGMRAADPRPPEAVAAAIVYVASARICHQRPERTFHLHGQPMPVCGRCTGLYVSGSVGLLVAGLVGRPRTSVGRRRMPAGTPPGSVRPCRSARWPATLDPRAGWIAVAAVPTLATWSLELLRVWDPGTPVRALAALPLGAIVGWLLGRQVR